MNVVEFAIASQDARLAALQAAARVPTVEAIKAVTLSAIQALELLTHSKRLA